MIHFACCCELHAQPCVPCGFTVCAKGECHVRDESLKIMTPNIVPSTFL